MLLNQLGIRIEEDGCGFFLALCGDMVHRGVPGVTFKIFVMTMEWVPPSHSKLFIDSLLHVVFAA